MEYRRSSLTQRGSRLARLRPGDRAPEMTVVTPNGSRRLQEVLRSGRHVIVVSSDTEGDLVERSDLCPLRDSYDVEVGDFGRSGAAGVWLVRPDGYCAATGIADSLAYSKSMFLVVGSRAQQSPQRV